MGILAKARRPKGPGRWVLVPRDMTAPRRRRQRVVRKRRQTFERLLAAAIVTLLLGSLPALRLLWWVHVALDAGIAVYVFQLLRWKTAEAQRARVVRPLPVEQPREEHAASESG